MRRKRPALFKGRHFEAEIIVLCVRRYLRFPLSFRNLEEIMAERNLSVDHVTIWRWVQRYAPELNRRCRPELRKTNRSWRWTRRMFASLANGPIYIERSIQPAPRSIFSCRPTRCSCGETLLSERIACTWPPLPTRDQRGREPVVSEGHRGTEADRRTRPALSMPTGSLLK